jgi:hypothetical protein
MVVVAQVVGEELPCDGDTSVVAAGSVRRCRVGVEEGGEGDRVW